MFQKENREGNNFKYIFFISDTMFLVLLSMRRVNVASLKEYIPSSKADKWGFKFYALGNLVVDM